jgi:hypothetical protein
MVQLVAMARMLSTLGFAVWDLGMAMAYKIALGGETLPR